MARRIAILIAIVFGAACAKPQPPPRSPAAVVAPPPSPAPPQVCYARSESPAPLSGDVEATLDPKRSVFVLDREMFPELARRLDHPSDLQKKDSLDRAIVQMVARRHVDEVTACYESLLAKTPDKSGTVTTRFLVAADGQVTRAQVTASTVADAATEDCIGQSLCTWRFPPLLTGHAVAFDYPFVLGPR